MSPEVLRVGLDARVYRARGIGRYTEQLHAGLLSQPDRVSVTTFSRTTDQRIGSWNRLRLPGYVAEEQLEMSLRFTNRRFDVVHLTANTAPAVRLRWPATVVTVHDVLFLKGPRSVPLSPSVRQTLGRAYRFAAFVSGTLWVDHIISGSRSTATELERMFGSRLPPVTVVPYSVSPSFGQPLDSGELMRTLGRYGLRHGRYLLHHGAVDPRKNTRTVISAFRAYRARGGTADLAVIGLPNGSRNARFAAEADARVHLLPFVPNADVVALVKGAFAVVYVPSAEGFGYPLIEAMAAGTPAIISSIEVLRENSLGVALEVPPASPTALADALLIAEGHPDELRSRTNRGLQRALEFNTERTASATIDVYAEAAARRRARHRRRDGRMPGAGTDH